MAKCAIAMKIVKFIIFGVLFGCYATSGLKVRIVVRVASISRTTSDIGLQAYIYN